MELLIPLVAIGGLYGIYNNDKSEPRNPKRHGTHEAFSGPVPPLAPAPNPGSIAPVAEPVRGPYTIPEPVAANENAVLGMGGAGRFGDVNKYHGTPYTTKYFDGTKDPNYVPPFQTTPPSANTTYESLTGPKPASYFNHDNMTPFFKGRGGRANQSSSDANAPMLDSYMGGGSTQITKQSQAPFFAPTGNHTWTHGTPNHSDYFQSRTYSSRLQNGARPFEEQSEGRGLTRDRTGADGQGAAYQNALADRDLYMPKTVDELRQGGNVKSSEHRLLGYEGPGQSHTTERPDHAPVYKNRPETFAAVGPERYFTTKGVETAPASQAEQIERFTQRQTTQGEYVGAASGTTEAIGAYALDQTHDPTWRQELGEMPVGIISAAGRAAGRDDYERKNMPVYANNRSVAPQETYFGSGVSTAVSDVVVPLLTTLRPSRKENAVGNVRPYENAKSITAPAYYRDPDRYLEETIRDTTHVENYLPGVSASTGQNGGAYKNLKIQVRPNERDTTTDFSYSGAAQAAVPAPRAHEEVDYRTNNNKIQTLESQMVRGNHRQFNANAGETTSLRRELERPNDRAIAATTGPQLTPSSSQLGQLQTRHAIQKDAGISRIDPALSDAFRNNPYFRR